VAAERPVWRFEWNFSGRIFLRKKTPKFFLVLLFSLPMASLQAQSDQDLTSSARLPDSDHSASVVGESDTTGDLEWLLPDDAEPLTFSKEKITADAEQFHRLRIQNSGEHLPISIGIRTPKSLLHDEFVAKVRVNSTIEGLQPGLQIVFPHQQDPRSGRIFHTIIPGNSYQSSGQWQDLRAQGNSSSLTAQLRRARTELQRSDIDSTDCFIRGLVIAADIPPGESVIDISSVAYGPVIVPQQESSEEVPPEQTAQDQLPDHIPVKADLNNIMIDRKAALLRMIPDHGEDISELQTLGINSVWVSDCFDSQRIHEFREAGIAVLATPPHPEFEPGDYSKLLRGLSPLNQMCPEVSGFILGTRVTPDQLTHLLRWSREVRSADRHLQRLHLADVTSAEGAVSREVELVGIGRHVTGRNQSFGELRNAMMQRRVTGPLSSPWTWIQVQPSSQQTEWRKSIVAELPVVEPEQIHHQIYASLSAGCKGIGFWKTKRLDADLPADRETSIAIELASLELSLLEPLLATGRIDRHIPLSSDGSGGRRAGQGNSKTDRWLKPTWRASVDTINAEEPAGPDAAVITSGTSTVLLGTWWDSFSQYVPGEMFLPEASVIVAASETATAYQLSLTSLKAIPKEVLAGGLSIRIRDFDQSATVLITSDPDFVVQMERQVQGVAARAAKLYVELADLKYRRVLQTIERLQYFGGVPADSDRSLKEARAFIDRAEHELELEDSHEAEILARGAMRSLRKAQSACWVLAQGTLISPSASPHLISFATLPGHWRLMKSIEDRQNSESENLMPSGSCENSAEWSGSGWKKYTADKNGFTSNAGLTEESASGNSILRLWASLPKTRQLKPHRLSDDALPLILSSPAVNVRPGDIVRVTFQIRRGSLIRAESRHPVVIFDSELGLENGLRPVLGQEWIPVEIFREIGGRSTEFRINFALSSMAEIHLDELKITRFPGSETNQSLIRTTSNTPPPEPAE
jgi:hypothetical protein